MNLKEGNLEQVEGCKEILLGAMGLAVVYLHRSKHFQSLLERLFFSQTPTLSGNAQSDSKGDVVLDSNGAISGVCWIFKAIIHQPRAAAAEQ